MYSPMLRPVGMGPYMLITLGQWSRFNIFIQSATRFFFTIQNKTRLKVIQTRFYVAACNEFEALMWKVLIGLKKKALITSFFSAKKRFGQAVLISLWFKLIR